MPQLARKRTLRPIALLMSRHSAADMPPYTSPRLRRFVSSANGSSCDLQFTDATLISQSPRVRRSGEMTGLQQPEQQDPQRDAVHHEAEQAAGMQELEQKCDG